MDQIEIKEINDLETWENFLSQNSDASFLQSWYWGEFHQLLNNKIKRIGFYKKSKLVGIMLSIEEKAKRAKFLTVPGGPIIEWENEDTVTAFINEIKKQAKENRCVFVRVRPQLRSDDFSKNIFKKNKFTDAPLHLHAELTSRLNIDKPEDEILANMRRSTRYEIKKAINEKIKVEVSSNPKLLKQFYDLQIETSKRQGFVPFSYNFLKEQFDVFAKNNLALLYTSRLDNKILAQAFVIFYGNEAVYHYGASTEEGRKHPGSYLIQWEAIKEAKKRGKKIYNFWGVAPENERQHRFSGLSIFKRGFGGDDYQYLHAQDLAINSLRYLAVKIFEETRKKMRRL